MAMLPSNLDYGDCILRSYRLKWMDGHYVMYPLFAAVFKHLSVFEDNMPTTQPATDDEFYTFPSSCNSELTGYIENFNFDLLSPRPSHPETHHDNVDPTGLHPLADSSEISSSSTNTMDQFLNIKIEHILPNTTSGPTRCMPELG